MIETYPETHCEAFFQLAKRRSDLDVIAFA